MFYVLNPSIIFISIKTLASGADIPNSFSFSLGLICFTETIESSSFLSALTYLTRLSGAFDSINRVAIDCEELSWLIRRLPSTIDQLVDTLHLLACVCGYVCIQLLFILSSPKIWPDDYLYTWLDTDELDCRSDVHVWWSLNRTDDMKLWIIVRLQYL